MSILWPTTWIQGFLQNKENFTFFQGFRQDKIRMG